MIKYRCSNIVCRAKGEIVYPQKASGKCPCGAPLEDYSDEQQDRDYELRYPELFKLKKLTHDEWCHTAKIGCDTGECINCKEAYNAGASKGVVI